MDQPRVNLAVMAVADVEIRIRSEVGLLDEPSPLYSSFRLPSALGSPGTSVVDLVVRAEAAPPNNAPTVFETGGPWYLQQEGSGYRISLWRSEGGPPRVVACSNRDTTRVTVFDSRAAAGAREETNGAPKQAVANPMSYPLDQLLLMNHLAPLGGVIVHAAGAVIGSKALVFAGASGAGKSTISQLLAGGGLGDSLLSDDRVILRLDQEGRSASSEEASRRITAWGTPWAGDAQVARNASAPLGAVLFLAKGDKEELVAMEAASALRRLLPMVSAPWYDAELFPAVLDTCSQIVMACPCYELRFRPTAEVVALLTGRSWDGEESR